MAATSPDAAPLGGLASFTGQVTQATHHGHLVATAQKGRLIKAAAQATDKRPPMPTEGVLDRTCDKTRIPSIRPCTDADPGATRAFQPPKIRPGMFQRAGPNDDERKRVPGFLLKYARH